MTEYENNTENPQLTKAFAVASTKLRLVGKPTGAMARPNNFPLNLIEPGKANWFEANMATMPIDVVRRHYVDYEQKLIAYENGQLPLSEADRLEIARIMAVLANHIDDALPVMAANIDDHDKLSGNRTREIWPAELPNSTMQMHFHWCELLHAFNLSVNRRSFATATVDEYAETMGTSRFVFTSKADRDDFIDRYNLSDFIVEVTTNEHDAITLSENLPVFWWLTLANRFNPEKVTAFLNTYRSAMNTLAIVQEERNRALRNDGGKVGYILADHFSEREMNALTTIGKARQVLGAAE